MRGAGSLKGVVVCYPAKLLNEWKRGRLILLWQCRYKGLFTEDDFRIAWNQRHSGQRFAEWRAAIHYHNKGYRVLSRYYRRIWEAKFREAEAVIGKRGINLLTPKRKGAVPPDLLVYRRGQRSYFFVEVKRDSDRLSNKQKEFFLAIEKLLGHPVRVLWLRRTK